MSWPAPPGQQRHFRLRVKVPVDLLTHSPKKELTSSLGTSNREDACMRGTALRARILQEFQDIRAKHDVEIRTSLTEVDDGPPGPPFSTAC